jgi:predicted metal-dependent HD superfamily phosphohydrolase
MKLLPKSLVDRAISLYSHLPYHGPDHPLVVVQEAYRLAGRPGVPSVDFEIVEAACLFHDALYEPMNKNNEYIASVVAFDELTKVGWSFDRSDAVARIVLDTESHKPDPFNLEACLVCDADLGGLAGSWDRFNEDYLLIQEEYCSAGVTPKQFSVGRGAFLEKVLESARASDLFFFPVELKERHEAVVRNIERYFSEQ